MNAGSLLITIVYGGLWRGASAWARQIYQGFRRPKELFGTRSSPTAPPFAFSRCTSSSCRQTSFVVGPLAIAHKATLWYWGGRIALLSSSLPIATYPQPQPPVVRQADRPLGRLPNFFEYTMHVLVAALTLSWFRHYVLLWWLVAYRYLDVGLPSPAEAAQHPGEGYGPSVGAHPQLGVIVTLYVLAFLAVYKPADPLAKVPGVGVPLHVPALGDRPRLGLQPRPRPHFTWIMTKKYTDSLLPANPGAEKTSSW